MRILLIVGIICTGLVMDTVTKYYFDQVRWQQYCYDGSPYVIQESLLQPNNIPNGQCKIDQKTGNIYNAKVDNRYYEPFIGDWIGWQVSYNTGIAFSLPISGMPLKVLTLCIIAYFCYYYIRTEWVKKNVLIDIGFAMIFTGAIAHAYERIYIGHVIDFISVKYFAILNFADILISIGALFFILGYVHYDKRNK